MAFFRLAEPLFFRETKRPQRRYQYPHQSLENAGIRTQNYRWKNGAWGENALYLELETVLGKVTR